MKRKRDRNESNYRRSKLNRWNKLLSKDFDWDYEFLLEMEYLKLSEMLEYFKNIGPILESWDCVVRDLKLALKLLDIVKDKDSLNIEFSQPGDIKSYRNLYINIKNSKRFLPNMDFSKKGDVLILYKEELRKEKAWRLYNLLRYYRMQTWWD